MGLKEIHYRYLNKRYINSSWFSLGDIVYWYGFDYFRLCRTMKTDISLIFVVDCFVLDTEMDTSWYRCMYVDDIL